MTSNEEHSTDKNKSDVAGKTREKNSRRSYDDFSLVSSKQLV